MPISEQTPAGDLFSVTGRTVLVTGGTSGIGRMIAAGFAAAGATVIVTSRKADAVERTVSELSEIGDVSGLTSDLSSEDGARALQESLAGTHGHLDVLINNAGATWGAPLDEHDTRSWRRVLDLNVEGVFHVTRFFLPMLKARATAEDPSRVINLGSVDGLRTPEMETYSYSASKAAVHQLSRHMARHLAPEITVNAIAPGAFQSKMMAATIDAFGEHIEASTPLRRLGRPDDMAGTAIFLASRAGSYITGATIPVSGGIATIY